MSDTQLIENPFAAAVPRSESVTAVIEASRAAQEVQAAVVMARKFPRIQAQAADRILQACQRYALAEHAVYSYPRGGQQVSGPSIRLAEAIAREWGNLQYGIIEQERRGDESTMLAYAWDLETNVTSRAEFKVKHYRDSNRDGKKQLTEERDIYEAVANNGARRLRACILKLIPGDVVDAAVKQCDETIRARVNDLPTAIAQMLEAFGTLGVSKEQIEKRLRHRIDATNAAEIVAMRRVFTSIQDGMGSPADYFEIEQAPPAATTQDKARQAAARAAGRPLTPSAGPGPGKAPAEPAMPQDEPQTAPLEAAKAMVLDYINNQVPAADRQGLVKDLGMAKTKAQIEDLFTLMINKYGEPALFGEEEQN